MYDNKHNCKHTIFGFPPDIINILSSINQIITQLHSSCKYPTLKLTVKLRIVETDVLWMIFA